MDVKKELTWLIKNALAAYDNEIAEKVSLQDFISDFLISSDVTIQKWTPVSEKKFPEDNSDVLACLWTGKESRVYPAFYAHGVWWDRAFGETTTNSTTHWMPQPLPPQKNGIENVPVAAETNT